jgi:hypothetical protein
MNRSRHFVFLLCLSVCGGLLSSVASAQSTAAATSSRSFSGTTTSQSKASSAGDELTATGTIQEVVTTPASGSPRGVHVILAGPQGTLDACLGPFLTTEVQQSLSTGQSVTAYGVLATFNGQEYLLVRQLTIGDRQITLRNRTGFLVHPANTNTRSNTAAKGDN